MRALVLGGAGAVCKETTRDLAEYSQYDEIVDRLRRFVGEEFDGHITLAGRNRCRIGTFRIDDHLWRRIEVICALGRLQLC